MKSSFRIFLAGCLIGLSSLASAQEHRLCSQHEMQEALYQAHPELKKATEEAFDENLKLAATLRSDQKNATYTIPVVFHIIYEPGREFANVSDEQIYEAVEITNKNFAGENPWKNRVIPEFQDIIGNASIELKIASRDPFGNCTSGINRYAQSLPDGGTDEEYKTGRQWPTDRYLNIYIVPRIASGAAGYAFFPVDGNEARDGVVLLYNYLGSTERSNAVRSFTLAHEVGHYLSLAHVWGRTNNPNLPQNCSDDDGIADTPTTIGSPNCSDVYRETCESLDNVQNFMDYSYCSYMFTEGQASTMIQTLNRPVAGRSNMVSQANLESTGVLYEGEKPDFLCRVDFSVDLDENIACRGLPVNFTDISLHNIASREWSFPGGEPSTSTDANPTVVYNSEGSYDVTLTVTTTDGEVRTVEKREVVQVLDQDQLQYPLVEDFNDGGMFDPAPFGWFSVYNPDGDEFWELQQFAGVEDNLSMVLRAFFINELGRVDAFYSAPIDIPVEASDATMSFYYAHAKRFEGTEDVLRIQISDDCGASWQFLDEISEDLETAPNLVQEESYIPEEEDWVEHTVDISQYAGSTVRVRFQYTNEGGNNIYIDKLRMYSATSISEETATADIALRPNPVQSGGSVSVNYPQQLHEAKLVNILGQHTPLEIVKSSQETYTLQLPNLKSGLYYLQMVSRNGQNSSLPLLIK